MHPSLFKWHKPVKQGRTRLLIQQATVDLEQLLLEHDQLTSREVERVTVLCSAARLVRGSRPVSFAWSQARSNEISRSMHASGQGSVTQSHRQLTNLANLCLASTEVCALVAISGWFRPHLQRTHDGFRHGGRMSVRRGCCRLSSNLSSEQQAQATGRSDGCGSLG